MRDQLPTRIRTNHEVQCPRLKSANDRDTACHRAAYLNSRLRDKFFIQEHVDSARQKFVLCDILDTTLEENVGTQTRDADSRDVSLACERGYVDCVVGVIARDGNGFLDSERGRQGVPLDYHRALRQSQRLGIIGRRVVDCGQLTVPRRVGSSSSN